MKCPYCNRLAVWVDNKEVYGKNYGKSHKIWLCKPCNAYVGCHNNTKKPLGTMADRNLRNWRIQAHNKIDWYWQQGMYTRKEVYQKLSRFFGEEIHIGSANRELCRMIWKNIEHIL